MAPMWNRSFYLLCLLHLRRRRRREQREREFWERPIVAARTLEGAYYTLYGRLREDERKFFNYCRMSTSTFDYIVDCLAPQGPKWLNAGLFIEGVASIAPTCRWSS